MFNERIYYINNITNSVTKYRNCTIKVSMQRNGKYHAAFNK